jgi:uncharacterized membrane protein
MRSWMRQHPWQVFVLVWAIVIAALLLILPTQASGGRVDWKAVGVALTAGLILSAGLTWGRLRQGRRQPNRDLKP